MRWKERKREGGEKEWKWKDGVQPAWPGQGREVRYLPCGEAIGDGTLEVKVEQGKHETGRFSTGLDDIVNNSFIH
jgi:hypothetical protein